MHETSPGNVEKRKLSINSDNECELHGAKMKTNIDMDTKSMNTNTEISQIIYDDPCDLIDDVSMFRLTRSRSWFCCAVCPTMETFCVPPAVQSNNIFNNRCPDYILITEAPKIQFHSVRNFIVSYKLRILNILKTIRIYLFIFRFKHSITI